MLNKNFTILIVEDNRAMLRLLESMVSGLGFANILTADNGTKAWQIIEENDIDVILCDLVMPGMSGLDLLNKIRGSQKYYSLPFIMVTGADKQSEIMYTLQAEVDHYMLKPPNTAKLDELLKTVIKQKTSPSKYDKAIIAGKFYYLNGNQAKALHYFEKAAQFQPDFPMPYYYIGKILKTAGDDDHAITNFNKCISISGLYINALLELSEIYDKRENNSLLINILEKLVQLLPERISIRRNLGVAYGRTKNTEKAAIQLNAAVKLAKGDKEILLDIVEDFISAGLYDEADDVYLRKYEEEDLDEIASFWNRLGNLCRADRAFTKAKNFYLSALKISPQDMETNLNLGHLLLQEKEFQGASSYVNKVLRLFPDCKEALQLKKDLAPHIP